MAWDISGIPLKSYIFSQISLAFSLLKNCGQIKQKKSFRQFHDSKYSDNLIENFEIFANYNFSLEYQAFYYKEVISWQDWLATRKKIGK